MKKVCLTLMFCAFSVIQLLAQSVSGKVVDEKNAPLPYVSVMLQNAADSVFVGGVATDEAGMFDIAVDANLNYTLLVSYVGYESVATACNAGNVGTIVLKENAKMLDEVSIIASRTQHNATGYTINLRSSEITKGKQTSDALAFLPGVTNEDGTYKINGLAVSEIYVDGMKLPSFDELKNLPADMIDKVNVNYLAGSNQNAAMAGGTIEISLRQPPKGGYYGALTAGVTSHFSYGFDENVGGTIYYRYKNLSIYDNLSLMFNQPDETADQTIWNTTTDLRSQIEEDIKYRGHTINNRLSLTQQIDNKNVIGASYYISTNKLNQTSNTKEKGAEALQSSVVNKNNYLDQEATLKYTTILTPRHTMLEIIADYYNRQADNTSNYKYSDNTASVADDETSLNMYKLSVDLTDPRSRTLVWKYGASLQYITSDYTPTLGDAASGRFPTSQIATETRGLTPLVYLSAMGQFWKIKYSIGVNWQLNKIEYTTLDNNEKSKDTQWGINPTVQMMMPLGNSGKHALMFNYKRMLDDIPYAAISSTIRWSDPYNYTVGNPDLKAPTSDMVMAGLSMFRNTLNLTAVYGRSEDAIYWETMQDATSPEVFYTTPVNLPTQNMFGVGAEFNWRPVKPWTLKMSGRLEIHPEDITLGGVYYGKTRYRQHYTMNNTFSFANGWGGMLNMQFEPTYRTFDRTYHAIYNIGGQIYKNLCNDNLQLTLSFNALGDRRKYDRYANGTKVTYNYTSPVQNVGVSVIWRFSGGKSVNVNAVENGSQNFKEVKDIR